ncbi:serine/threonine-protein kinase [Herbidospora mongoliensis]|uniref:serine/threonine-protein kinase n=1 Tax=Herbidospora mongoliensis TaxID=688067 RepID=UPI000833B626|nr:serine/threonine-protein kinase [Herbidospora mongoliensis]
MTTDRLLGMVPDGQGGSTPEGQGRLVGRRYRLLSPVGRGGMGMVWHAHDVLLDRDVAVKELILPYGLDQQGRQTAHTRMLREARSAARLSHPGIVTVHDVVEEDGRPWIVMELVRAWSLEQAVRQSGPLPVVQAAEIGIRVLDALRHAHAAGILHRDVKPGNVLLTADRVVLTDFGIAAIEGDVSITHPGLLMGSPAYIPPERLQGRQITFAADLWSFGATLYAAVEGRPPYEGPDAVAVLGAVLTQEPNRPGRAGALMPVIEGLLRKNPADRLPAAQISEMLENVLRQHGVGVRPASPVGPPAPSPAPTPADPMPVQMLPPLDPPSGPMPSRIIETPSGPVRVPYDPNSPSGGYNMGVQKPDPLSSPTGDIATTGGVSFFAPITPSKPGGPSRPAPTTGPNQMPAGPARHAAASGGWPMPEQREAPDVSELAKEMRTGNLFDRPGEKGAPDRGAAPRPSRRRREPDDDGGGSRSSLLAVVAAVAVIAVIVLVLLIMVPGDGTPAEPQGRPANSGTGQAADPTEPDVPASPEGELPEGYRNHTAGNVTVAVPDTWKVAAQDGAVVLTGPKDSGQSGLIEEIPDGDLAALKVTEAKASFEEYTQLALAQVDYRWPASEWEYTHRNEANVTVHTAVRYVTVDGRSYAVTFTAPDYDWTESAANVRATLWSSFSPA